MNSTEDFEARKALRARLQELKTSSRGKQNKTKIGLNNNTPPPYLSFSVWVRVYVLN